MELVTLNSSFQPDKLVENYESLIWTERYATNGEFELKSSEVSTIVNLLPLEISGVRPPTYVSLRESTVPMLVETHKIEKPPGAAPTITVTGRTFETVMERRASVRTPMGSARTVWYMAASKESDAAFRAMRIVLGDSIKTQSGHTVLPVRTPVISANDAIPEIRLILPADYEVPAWSSTFSYGEGDTVGVGTVVYQATALSPNLNKAPASNPTYWTSVATGMSGTWGDFFVIEIKPANLYATVIELVTTNHHGLKSIRPIPGVSTVGVEVYNGANLTGEGSGSDPNHVVVFDARFDQIDNATYLLSEQGSTNVAYVYSSSSSSRVLKTAAAEPSGLARKVLLVDAAGDATITDGSSRTSRGLIELYKYNATTLFDGEVAVQVANLYNQPNGYFLGDIIKLVGEYETSQDVRVSEFIRSTDSGGEKAYPTFEAVDSSS